MRTPLASLTALLAFASLSTIAPVARAGAPLPGPIALASPDAPAPTHAGPSAAVAAEPPPVSERVRRGIVMIERDGHLLGFGTVLAGDGRVVTALSTLGTGETADVRYADGAVARARLGHKDKAWDLALLVPQSGKWKDGLSASEADPAAVELRAPIPLRIGAKPIALPVHYKGRTDALSRDGEALLNALDVELHNTLPVAGAPIVDAAGTVVGVIVRACRVAMLDANHAAGPQIACAPALIGAPVSALRNFLIAAPASAVQPSPWLGIVGQTDSAGSVRGVRVMAVAPQSPAEKGGLHTNTDREKSDLIVAVDGAPIDSPEKLADAIAKRAIGDTVKLLVLGPPAPAKDPKADAKKEAKQEDTATPTFRELAVQLRGAP